jgi:hypothetical protein
MIGNRHFIQSSQISITVVCVHVHVDVDVDIRLDLERRFTSNFGIRIETIVVVVC